MSLVYTAGSWLCLVMANLISRARFKKKIFPRPHIKYLLITCLLPVCASPVCCHQSQPVSAYYWPATTQLTCSVVVHRQFSVVWPGHPIGSISRKISRHSCHSAIPVYSIARGVRKALLSLSGSSTRYKTIRDIWKTPATVPLDLKRMWNLQCELYKGLD